MKTEIVISDELLSLAAKVNAAKGGKSKSPKKMAAMRKNIRKAWAARRKAA